MLIFLPNVPYHKGQPWKEKYGTLTWTLIDNHIHSHRNVTSNQTSDSLHSMNICKWLCSLQKATKMINMEHNKQPLRKSSGAKIWNNILNYSKASFHGYLAKMTNFTIHGLRNLLNSEQIFCSPSFSCVT